MVKKLILLALIIMESFLSDLYTQTQFSIHAQLRPRFEYRNGYARMPTIDDKPAYFISQRSRLYVHYKNSQFKYLMALQDVRVWGDATIYKSTGVYGSEASIDLYQAHLQWWLNKKSSIQLGRQVLAYDDERLLGSRNWNQHGIAYDALIFKAQVEDWDTHLGLSLNNNRENKYGNIYEQDKMKTLNYIHLQKSLKNNGHFSLLAIGSGYTASDSSEVIYMRGTLGGYLMVKQYPFDYSFSGYYQFGRNEYGMPVRAYLWTAAIKWYYQFFFTGFGIDYISGNGESSHDTTDRQFNLLYGARHRYYGLMDYFSDVAVVTHSRGLNDIWLQTSYKTKSNFSFGADFHYFTLQDNKLPFGEFLGIELDLIFSRQCTPDFKLTGGFSFFKSSDYFQSMQIGTISGRTPCWAWLMLDFTPILFKSDKNKFSLSDINEGE